jgi:hypothetical protein
LALSSATPEQLEAFDAMYQYPLRQGAEQVLRKLLQRGSSDGDLLAALARLHNEERLVIQAGSGHDAIRIKTTMGVCA